MTANDNGDDNSPPPPQKKTTSQIEEQFVRDGITTEYMPLSSTLVPKRKKQMLYVPLDFEKGVTIDGLNDSGAYVSAITQTELDRIKQQTPTNIFKIDDPLNFQFQVPNGQLQKHISTATPNFDIKGNTFAEHFVVLKNLKADHYRIALHEENNVVIDTTHGLIQFPHLRRQAKNAAIETSAKPRLFLIQDNTKVPTMTTKTITALFDHPSEWHTTGTVRPVGKFTEEASQQKSLSLSTIIFKNTAVRITNTTESPFLIKKTTQVAEFSVLTPEQSKFIRPVDTAILNMIPEVDLDLTTSLSELIRTNKSEQQNNTFWFPTPENPQ